MANLSIRRVDDEVVEKLKQHARRESVSMEEKVRRILADAVAPDEPLGTLLRRIVGNDGADLKLPPREVTKPRVDFNSPEYGDGD